jgi:hypothetical protein
MTRYSLPTRPFLSGQYCPVANLNTIWNISISSNIPSCWNFWCRSSLGSGVLALDLPCGGRSASVTLPTQHLAPDLTPAAHTHGHIEMNWLAAGIPDGRLRSRACAPCARTYGIPFQACRSLTLLALGSTMRTIVSSGCPCLLESSYRGAPAEGPCATPWKRIDRLSQSPLTAASLRLARNSTECHRRLAGPADLPGTIATHLCNPMHCSRSLLSIGQAWISCRDHFGLVPGGQ